MSTIFDDMKSMYERRPHTIRRLYERASSFDQPGEIAATLMLLMLALIAVSVAIGVISFAFLWTAWAGYGVIVLILASLWRIGWNYIDHHTKD